MRRRADGRRQRSDPVLDGLRAPLATAMTALVVERLKWPVEARYEILNDRVSESWNWGSRRRSLEAMTDLRRAQALDPRLKILVAHGLYDLVSPYYANKLLLDLAPLSARRIASASSPCPAATCSMPSIFARRFARCSAENDF